MISIIILTYNSSKYISSLLEGLNKKFSDKIKNNSLEIIVADNNSSDDTVKLANKYKDQVNVVENKSNVGFAKGNNLASKKAQGEYLVFLNPDVEFIKGDVFDILNLFEDDSVGIVGGRINSWSGKREYSCGKFYTPFNVFLLTLGLEEKLGVRFSPGKEQEVDFVSGGFLMIRKNLFEKLKGFDEDYFMYIEDSDLCFRAKKQGFKTLFSPLATVKHVGQGSSNKKFAIVNIYKGLLKFNKKHMGDLSYWSVKLMLSAKAVFLVILGRIIDNEYLVSTYSEAKRQIN